MEALIAVLSIFSFLLLAIGIAYYVIGSIFAYKIAKLEGCTYPFLAWIPLAMYYNFFEMMRKINLHSSDYSKLIRNLQWSYILFGQS